MACLRIDQRETIRTEREAGAGFPELSGRHRVSRRAIQKCVRTEGCGDKADTGAAIQRKVAERVQV